jgi:tetratricopeptide (TPR) repeat protein
VVRPRATAGDLAVFNLESSRARSWHVLKRWPDRPGTAERIVEEEQRRAQFLGDASALDRLADLSSELCRVGPASPDAHLVATEVASIRHHFADAKEHLRKAEALGAPADATRRIKLAIAQALGEDLSEVLAARMEMARSVPDIQNLVPLGALFADIGEYEEADSAYARAIQSYRNASPFPLAWACFQLGVLWGETAPERDRKRAAQWYERAMEYLPMYVKARVHLAEIRNRRRGTPGSRILASAGEDTAIPKCTGVWRKCSRPKAGRTRLTVSARPPVSVLANFSNDMTSRSPIMPPNST